MELKLLPGPVTVSSIAVGTGVAGRSVLDVGEFSIITECALPGKIDQGDTGIDGGGEIPLVLRYIVLFWKIFCVLHPPCLRGVDGAVMVPPIARF